MPVTATQAVRAQPSPAGPSLRIAFRVGAWPSLSETFVRAQVNGMAARGHRVSVLADRLCDPPPGGPPARAARPRHPLLARAEGALPWRLRRALVARAERRHLAAADVVVCNFGWFGADVARAFAGVRGRPRIVTIFHGDDVSRSLGAGLDYRDLFAAGDLLLAVSELWRRRLVDLGAPEEKVRVHRMGVDLSAHPFLSRPVDRPVRSLVHVGRLVEKKGTEHLLRALAIARRDPAGAGLSLAIVGDGPLGADLRALAEALGLGDAVEFTGPLPHDAVRARLAAADLFVLPSVTAADGDMEGIPVALMEAMAAGLPVVSTRHSGIPELVEDGANGLLAGERDAEGLAAQILRMVSRPQERTALAAAARRTIEARFDNRRLDDALEAMLHEVVHGPKAIALPGTPGPPDRS